MTDHLDTSPIDHGSDRYDYVEVTGPGDPPAETLARVLVPCEDCRANAFLRMIDPTGLDADPSNWHLTVAHDEGCPTFSVKDR